MSNRTADADIAVIARAVLQLARRLRKERPEDSVTLSTLGLLATLHRQGPMPAAGLAKAERLKPQSLTRLIADMENDGLIVRRADETDHRTLRIAITRAGRSALKRDMDARREWLTEAMAAALTANERTLLADAAAAMLRLADYAPAASHSQ